MPPKGTRTLGLNRIGPLGSVTPGITGVTVYPLGMETTTKSGDPPPAFVSQPLIEQSQAVGTPEVGSTRSMFMVIISDVSAGRIGSMPPASVLLPVRARLMAAMMAGSAALQRSTPCCVAT